MDRKLPSTFPVLSPEHVVPSLADLERSFAGFLVSMKRKLRPGFRKEDLSYKESRTVKDLAADAFSRRVRQAGLTALSKEARLQVIELAQIGATLRGPETEDAIYSLVADLHAESPWMNSVTTWVMNELLGHFAEGTCGLALPPVILAGPPGIGKSYYARRLAELAGTPSRLIDVGGGSAGFRIVGTERGWHSAQAGIPVETILSSRVANPVMIVDEVDKAGTMFSNRGTATSLTTSLLPLLDSGTSRRFECPYHRLTFDMSRVVWIMTANDADLIPVPLRDRARIFHLGALSTEDAIQFFDRLTSGHGDETERDQCRKFIERVTRRPRGISLRQIGQLANAVSAPARRVTH